MKIIRYTDPQGVIRLGEQRPNGSSWELDGDLFDPPKSTDRPAKIATLLAPLQPTNLLCVGLNYRQHAKESRLKEPEFPVLFMKATSAVQNPGGPIILPRHLRSDAVDYECELAVVIGRAAKNVPRDRAFDYVLGYTLANDVSARDWQIQRGGSQWCRGKTFDTFCPLGPCLVTKEEISDPSRLRIRTLLNGQVMQDWPCDDMIFDIPALIEFLSGSTTLLPGTVILTGTPHGVGFARQPTVFLQPGDEVRIEVDEIGSLVNSVIEE